MKWIITNKRDNVSYVVFSKTKKYAKKKAVLAAQDAKDNTDNTRKWQIHEERI